MRNISRRKKRRVNTTRRLGARVSLPRCPRARRSQGTFVDRANSLFVLTHGELPSAADEASSHDVFFFAIVESSGIKIESCACAQLSSSTSIPSPGDKRTTRNSCWRAHSRKMHPKIRVRSGEAHGRGEEALFIPEPPTFAAKSDCALHGGINVVRAN